MTNHKAYWHMDGEIKFRREFKFAGATKIHTIHTALDADNRLWFAAEDVRIALGLRAIRPALEGLDEQYIAIVPITPPHPKNMRHGLTALTSKGLLALIQKYKHKLTAVRMRYWYKNVVRPAVLEAAKADD